ncbi:MAG: SIMPL domain-containing protein [Proteobacteria bacterium]|nr:SIMPL domain-containing protein [Pseudomonadota bacterium]
MPAGRFTRRGTRRGVWTLGLLGLAWALGSLATDVQAEERRKRGGVVVPGRGVASAEPDVARVGLAVVTQADTAAAAVEANNQAAAAVLKALARAGVAKRDLQTQSFQVTPRYRDYKSREAGEIAGYDVQNRVQVTVRKLEELGALLDAGVRAGANRVDGIAFDVDDPEPLRVRARKAAMADARARAEQLAEAEGVTLGRVRRVEELGPQHGGPVPFQRAQFAAEAAAVPIETGEIQFSVEVRVVYGLGDGEG